MAHTKHETHAPPCHRESITAIRGTIGVSSLRSEASDLLDIRPISALQDGRGLHVSPQPVTVIHRRFNPSSCCYFHMFLFLLTKNKEKEIVKVSSSQSKPVKCSTNLSTVAPSRSFAVRLLGCVKTASSGSPLWEMGGSQVIDSRTLFVLFFLCCIC